MRTLFLIGNVFFLAAAAALAYLNISFRATPPDPILKETVDPASFKAEAKTPADRPTQDFSPLWDDNVFSPFRTKEDGEVFSSLKVTGLELVGVYSYGDRAGAIIIDKGASQPAAQPAARPASTPRQSGAQVQTGLPLFYRKDDQLPNGFVLKEVNMDSVVLARGKEQIILQLDIDDDGSIKRAENATKTSLKNDADKGDPGDGAQADDQERKDVPEKTEAGGELRKPALVPPVPQDPAAQNRKNLPRPGQVVR